MAYCDASDVARYNIARGTYGASTKPTATQVAFFINEIAGEIDTHLRRAGYPVPISGSYITDYTFLRGINAAGAAWKVEVSAETSDNEGMYRTMYQSALKMLDNVELESPKDANQSMPRSPFGAPGQGAIFGLPSHAMTTTEF